MCSKAALKHIHGLQHLPTEKLRLKEKGFSNPSFPALQESPLQHLVGNVDSADTESLRKAVRTAELWISLLEGERKDLSEQLACMKRKFDGCQTATVGVSNDVGQIATVGASEALAFKFEQQDKLVAELKCKLANEHEERHRLEQQLAKERLQYGELLQLKERAHVALAFYEDQLQKLAPDFERINLETFQGWLRQPDSDLDNAVTPLQRMNQTLRPPSPLKSPSPRRARAANCNEFPMDSENCHSLGSLLFLERAGLGLSEVGCRR